MQSILALVKSLLEKILAFFRGLRGDAELDEPSRIDPETVVCYYGCPNSKKAEKLQLSKKVYR